MVNLSLYQAVYTNYTGISRYISIYTSLVWRLYRYTPSPKYYKAPLHTHEASDSCLASQSCSHEIRESSSVSWASHPCPPSLTASLAARQVARARQCIDVAGDQVNSLPPLAARLYR